MSRIIYIILLLTVTSCSTLTTPDTYIRTDDQTITQETLVENKNISTRLYEVTTTDTLISLARIFTFL